MHGFTFQPSTGRWYSPQDGGIWFDPSKGEYFAERLQVWTVGKRWPAQSGPAAPAVGILAPTAGARLRAANSGSWTLDGGEDPMLAVRESVFALPRLDRLRLIAWLIDELDEPDDKQGFEEFRDRVRREGLSWTDRAEIYRLFGQRPAGGSSSVLTDAFARGIRGALDLPANGTERPRIKGRRSR